MAPRYEVIGVEGIGEVRPRDDVAALVIQAAARQGTPLRGGDVLVISQKIVSKSEGRLLRLDEVTPSTGAIRGWWKSSCASRGAWCAWIAACS
jgi:coenzyme F420-0:L-glutamate ligase/coenzyme F420-1:gamma-L-glutamate ligase